jgi:hypothetical protein
MHLLLTLACNRNYALFNKLLFDALAFGGAMNTTIFLF